MEVKILTSILEHKVAKKCQRASATHIVHAFVLQLSHPSTILLAYSSQAIELSMLLMYRFKVKMRYYPL